MWKRFVLILLPDHIRPGKPGWHISDIRQCFGYPLFPLNMGVKFLFPKGSVVVPSLLKLRVFFFLWFVFFLYPVICGLVRGRRFVLFFSEFSRLAELSRRWFYLILSYLRLFKIFLIKIFSKSFVLVFFWNCRSSHN